jgi:hypothetical protein
MARVDRGAVPTVTAPACLTAALGYAAKGLRVLALEPPIPGDDKSGKRPIAALCPNGVNSATDDPDTIHRWWKAHPTANVGIAIPADWLVVDVDPRNGGVDSFDALAREHGPETWPETLEATTGGTGAHLVYAVPSGARFPGKLPGRKGLDFKGQGGYIVAAPSGHYTGGSYSWGTDLDPAPIPEWLACLERGVATVQGDPGASDRELTSAEQASLDDLAVALEPHFELGQRNALALAIGGALRNAGLPPSAADYVIGQLPSNAPEKRLKDALGAWRAPVAKGMSALKDILPVSAFADVERVDLRPDWMRRAEQRQAERATVAAAPAASGPLPPAAAAGATTDPYALLGSIADLNVEPDPLDYLIDGLPFACGGKVNAIQAQPKGAKTPTALLLCACVASGKPFLGRAVLKPGPCLYLDAETGRLALIRYRRICRALGVDPAALPFQFRNVEAMFSPEYLNTLEALLAAEPKRLVVIDTYGAMLAADIDNNSPQFAFWLRMLGRLSRTLDVVIVVLIHEKKSGSRRGSGLEMIAGNYQGAGAFQASIALVPTGKANEDPIEVSCERAPEHDFAPFQIRWEDVTTTPGKDLRAGGPGLRAVLVDEERKPDVAAVEEKQRAKVARGILESLKRTPHQNKTKVVKGTRGAGEKVVARIFDDLVEAGILLELKTAERVNGRGEVEPILVYEAAALSPAVLEKKLKAGIVE